MNKSCKHCSQDFEARRKNHVYCCNSCKTMASYKRNNYKYIPGHFQKENDASLTPVTNKIETKITTLEDRIKKLGEINVPSITNAAIGSAAADVTLNGIKKIFAPKLLPANKGDIEMLKKEISELKLLLYRKNNFNF